MTSFDSRTRQAGFSYLWTLMVVAMLGLGMSIAAELYAVSAQREREKELLFVGHQFRAALRSYYQSQMRAGRKEYPASLEELLKDSRFPGIRRHLRRIYRDPVGGGTEWGLVRVGGRIVGVHSLSQQQPLKQDNFDLEDAAFASREHYSDWVFTYPANALAEPELAGEGAAAQPTNGLTPLDEPGTTGTLEGEQP
jgi:type II secretory pathway pseudopilin PulG